MNKKWIIGIVIGIVASWNMGRLEGFEVGKRQGRAEAWEEDKKILVELQDEVVKWETKFYDANKSIKED